jgi:uncharacterized membrane protein
MSARRVEAAELRLPASVAPGVSARTIDEVVESGRGARRWRAVTTPAGFVYCAAGAWVVACAGLAALRDAAFATARFDLGNMVQAVWSTAHGRFLETTSGSGLQFTRLGAHFDPILAFFAPLWWVWPSPLLLVFVQALALGAGAVPVYWLGRKHLPSPTLAAWFAAAYLLYAPLQWLPLDDFHPVALGVPLLLAALWYLDEDRLRAFAVFALLASLTGEEMPALVGLLGIWYALRRRRVRVGALILATGLAASAVVFYVIIPAFSPGASVFAGRYDAFGGSPGGLATAFVHRPLDVLAALSSGRDIGYTLALLVPWAGLFLLEPLLAFGAVPMLLLNLISSNPNQAAISFHYTAPIIPFVVGASVLGAARLPRNAVRHAGLVVLVIMTLGLMLSPGRLVVGYVNDLRGPERAASLAALQLIPPGVPVAASNRLGGHLSERRRILAFPVLADAQWAVVDSDDGFVRDVYAPRSFAADVARLRHDPHWKSVFDRDGVLVLHRVRPGGPVSLESR